MFFSASLVSPDTPLGKLWIASFSGNRKLTRKDFDEANIKKLTAAMMMFGVVTIMGEQIRNLMKDVQVQLKKLEDASTQSTKHNHTQPARKRKKSNANAAKRDVELPDPDDNPFHDDGWFGPLVPDSMADVTEHDSSKPQSDGLSGQQELQLNLDAIGGMFNSQFIQDQAQHDVPMTGFNAPSSAEAPEVLRDASMDAPPMDDPFPNALDNIARMTPRRSSGSRRLSASQSAPSQRADGSAAGPAALPELEEPPPADLPEVELEALELPPIAPNNAGGDAAAGAARATPDGSTAGGNADVDMAPEVDLPDFNAPEMSDADAPPDGDGVPSSSMLHQSNAVGHADNADTVDHFANGPARPAPTRQQRKKAAATVKLRRDVDPSDISLNRSEVRGYIKNRAPFLHSLPSLLEAAESRQTAMDFSDAWGDIMRVRVPDAHVQPPAVQRHLRAIASARPIPRAVWTNQGDDAAADDAELEEEIEDDGMAAGPSNASPAAGSNKAQKRKRGGADAAEVPDYVGAAADAAQNYEDGVMSPQHSGGIEQLRDADAATPDAVGPQLRSPSGRKSARSDAGDADGRADIEVEQPDGEGMPSPPNFDMPDAEMPPNDDPLDWQNPPPDDYDASADPNNAYAASPEAGAPEAGPSGLLSEASQVAEDDSLNAHTQATLFRLEQLSMDAGAGKKRQRSGGTEVCLADLMPQQSRAEAAKTFYDALVLQKHGKIAITPQEEPFAMLQLRLVDA